MELVNGAATEMKIRLEQVAKLIVCKNRSVDGDKLLARVDFVYRLYTLLRCLCED